MEFTQENFDTLMSKASGLEKAVQAERASKKELSSQVNDFNSRFADIEKGKATAKERELVKQGKLEQLLEQKNQSITGYESTISEHLKTIDDMTSKVTKFNEYKLAQEAKAMDALAKKMEAFDESKRETLMGLVKDKPVEEQGAIIDQLISLQGTPDYKVNPKAGEKTINTDVNYDLKKAQDSGDYLSMIANSPAKQPI